LVQRRVEARVVEAILAHAHLAAEVGLDPAHGPPHVHELLRGPREPRDGVLRSEVRPIVGDTTKKKTWINR